MLFNSLTFAIFFMIVLVIYNALSPYFKLQNKILLVASFIFYGWWNWKLLFLLSFSIAFDYFMAKAIYSEKKQKKRELVLFLSIAVNLVVLGFFKYFNFFAQNLVFLLDSLGLHLNFSALNIILPIGISFYTFQSMSYVIDVYRGGLKPADSIFEYALFVSFFPQLVAGPILRARSMLPQFQGPRKATGKDYNLGFWLIIWGLFKKIVIADNCALIVDRVFKQGALIGGGDLLISTVLFAFQIYCDFSGYSDMAIGLARTLGFHIDINFNLPYFSKGVKEFWQRWHISLSTWLRDYLYIPLGGNRGGSLETHKNLMFTMLLGGLWHGASWTFVIWGAFHGLLLSLERFFQNRIKLWVPLSLIFTFCAVNFGWLIFRAESFGHLKEMFAALSAGFLIRQPYPGISELLFYIIFLVGFQVVQFKKKDLYFIAAARKNLRIYIYSIVIIFIFFSGNFSAHQFIYFQF
ncbi:MAG: MBOAT family O-acyltransferase [Candidatus Omnitrophota bacterium]